MRKRGILFFICISVLAFSCSKQGGKKDSSGLFPISQNDKYGYIDRTGKITIKPQFDWAGAFSEGLAGEGMGKDKDFI